MTAGHWIISLAIVAACLPMILFWGMWLLFIVLAALPTRPQKNPPPATSPTAGTPPPVTIDILIPAHDEEALLPRLLETLRLQTAPHHLGRILVVADHCSDRTAPLARDAHADVLERNTGPRGKPAALRDGLAWLDEKNAAGPDPLPPTRRAVLILDADCTVSPNLIEQTAAAMAPPFHGAQGGAEASVTQAAYVLDPSSAPQRLHAPAHIAFALKNDLRPRGMARLGLPTQLFGTGNCFRADVLHLIAFRDHLTEDLAISHDLLRAGINPRFLPAALVRSPLPQSRSAMSTQKLRWETGQLQTWKKLPALFSALLAAGRFRAALALLDWSAPPVALGIIFIAGVAFASACLVAAGWAAAWSVVAPAIALLLLAAYVALGGLQISGIAGVLRLTAGIPRFLFWKVALYLQILAGRGPRAWQRTPRQPGMASSAIETK